MKMTDFTLEEMIRVEDLIRRQCPNITKREHNCKGWTCTWINKGECIFLHENPVTQSTFYNFTVPRAQIKPRRKQDPFDAIVEAI